jgi:hypothetical protein
MAAVWPSREPIRQKFEEALQKVAMSRPMPGISDARALHALTLQLVASLRREQYTEQLMKRSVSFDRADPNSAHFDADRAVVYHLQQNDLEEAAWLIFLMTHFGKPAGSGWKRLADVYGKLGKGRWSWAAVSVDPPAFEAWLASNWKKIGGKFGNHRKYETLDPGSANSTGKVVSSYVAWIGSSGSHRRHFADVIRATGNDPGKIFDALYRGMQVLRFGRLARFDYLALIGRFGIAPIAPNSAYLDEATGPAKGARLLFGITTSGRAGFAALQAGFTDLSSELNVGMQILEDAVCNWQKSPKAFKHFKG